MQNPSQAKSYSKPEAIKVFLNTNLSLRDLSENLKDDRDVVLTAVKKDGGNILYASERLKADREIALVAVQNQGYALAFLPDSLQDDKEIVMTAINQNGLAIEAALPKFREDREVALAAVKQVGLAFIYLPFFHNDKEIALIASKDSIAALCCVSEQLKREPEFVNLYGNLTVIHIQTDDELVA